MAFSHFHGCAVNNLGIIFPSHERVLSFIWMSDSSRYSDSAHILCKSVIDNVSCLLIYIIPILYHYYVEIASGYIVSYAKLRYQIFYFHQSQHLCMLYISFRPFYNKVFHIHIHLLNVLYLQQEPQTCSRIPS